MNASKSCSNRLASLPILGLALLLAWQGLMTFKQDLAFIRAKTEVGFWGRGEYQPRPATVKRTGNTTEALLKARPAQPEYLALAAGYASWQGYWAEDPAARERLNNMAVEYQQSALKSRPAHRHNWQKLVEYASRSSDGAPVMAQAQTRIAALQPRL